MWLRRVIGHRAHLPDVAAAGEPAATILADDGVIPAGTDEGGVGGDLQPLIIDCRADDVECAASQNVAVGVEQCAAGWCYSVTTKNCLTPIPCKVNTSHVLEKKRTEFCSSNYLQRINRVMRFFCELLLRLLWRQWQGGFGLPGAVGTGLQTLSSAATPFCSGTRVTTTYGGLHA
jgi:hypothetical protein